MYYSRFLVSAEGKAQVRHITKTFASGKTGRFPNVVFYDLPRSVFLKVLVYNLSKRHAEVVALSSMAFNESGE
jgi:hypothetical protein